VRGLHPCTGSGPLHIWWLTRGVVGSPQSLTKDVPDVELGRAKRAALGTVLSSLEGRAIVAEDIGRQILTYGHRCARGARGFTPKRVVRARDALAGGLCSPAGSPRTRPQQMRRQPRPRAAGTWRLFVVLNWGRRMSQPKRGPVRVPGCKADTVALVQETGARVHKGAGRDHSRRHHQAGHGHAQGAAQLCGQRQHRRDAALRRAAAAVQLSGWGQVVDWFLTAGTCLKGMRSRPVRAGGHINEQGDRTVCRNFHSSRV
jgi:hypothetical protein